MLNKEERIELLQDAQMDINNAIEKIRQAMGDTSSWGRVKGYLVSQLELAIGSDNEWLGKNPSNIQSIIEDIENDEA